MTSSWSVPSVAVAVLVGCGLSMACADLSRGPLTTAADSGADLGGPADGGDGGGDDAAPSFAASVHPVLIAGCQSCHADGQQAGDTELLFTGDAAADYVSVSRFVDTSAPTASRLLSKSSGSGHGGGTVFAIGSPEYQIVLRWMQQGARP